MALDLWTSAQAAEYLKVDLRTIRRMIDDGRLPYEHKLPGESGAYLFKPDEVRRVGADRAEKLLARVPGATEDVA